MLPTSPQTKLFPHRWICSCRFHIQSVRSWHEVAQQSLQVDNSSLLDTWPIYYFLRGFSFLHPLEYSP